MVGTAHSASVNGYVLAVPTTERGTAHSTPFAGYVRGRRAALWKGRRIARLLRATLSVGAPPLWKGRRIARL